MHSLVHRHNPSAYLLNRNCICLDSVGGVMSLNAGVLPALEQLGLYEDLQKISLPATGTFNIYKDNMSLIASVKSEPAEM